MAFTPVERVNQHKGLEAVISPQSLIDEAIIALDTAL